jgi:hypothetical protein
MKRTPLVAGGFLAGALLCALPPVQMLWAELRCSSDGGRWLAHSHACEFPRDGARVSPGDVPRPLVIPAKGAP